MSGPPPRPRGVPPPMMTTTQTGRPPPLAGVQSIRGVGAGDAKSTPGPPPGAAPVTALKPPPMAPPPRALMQTMQRPAPESIRPINIPKGPPPRGPPPGVDASGPRGMPGRGPPPQVLQTDFQQSEPIAENKMASPKFVDTTKPTQGRKAGAISMFEAQEEPPQEPADKKVKMPRGPPPRGQAPNADPSMPMVRMPRPLPPRPTPPGIPVGQPLPPDTKPENEVKAPPPAKPAPNRNRAPPRGDPDARPPVADPNPPGTIPPYIKGKKANVEEAPYVPRREREMPEFDESSSEEEKGDVPVRKVPQGASSRKAATGPPGMPAGAVPQIAAQPTPKVVAPAQAVVPAPIPAAVRTPASAPTPVVETPVPVVTAPPVSAPITPVQQAIKEEIIMLPSDETSTGEHAANAFAPPPPVHQEIDFTSKIAKELSQGRLCIKCLEGFEIRKKDEPNATSRTDPYFKFRLGAAERHPWKQTKVKRKQNNFPKFDDEVVTFDVLDPIQYVLQEDLQLVIEVWNKSATRDEMLGSVSMSVVRFFVQPFVAYEEKVPIYYPGKSTTDMKVKLEFMFEQARQGMFLITLFEAHGLRNIDQLGQQNPYVHLGLGPHYHKQSTVVRGGGTDPYFSEEEMMIYVDHENWSNDLQLNLYDQDIGHEKSIASTNISLLHYMNTHPDNAQAETIQLFYSHQADIRDEKSKQELAGGEIIMRIKFLPAGSLKLFLDRAKHLTFPETHSTSNPSRMDPYVKFIMDGKAVQVVKRSPADKDGGQDPTWQYEIGFDVVDQYQIEMEVYNQSAQNGDVLLGYNTISLLPVFRNGSSSIWTTLKQKKANGGIREIGDVKIDFTFLGPAGIKYPQCRPEIDAFDDRMRKPPEKKKEVDEDEDVTVPEPISTIPIPVPDVKLKQQEKEKSRQAVAEANQEALVAMDAPMAEFTDEEIVNAFKFIDLDHNNFVGAKEIRHILVCMGEMVTDEEIDTMIGLVDSDGDGQVSFEEFRALVLHPDPGAADMHKEIANKREEALSKDKQAMRGKTSGLDLSTFQRQKEMSGREEKKKMLVAFVADNEVTFDYVKHSFQGFLDLSKERRIRGRIRFEDFCKVLGVEPISEYKILHGLFDTETLGDIDFKEFMLSMMNFVEIDKELRMRFSFTMFDELKTGFITQKEVEEILRGNHMISLASVQRKAETVMRQAKSNSAGAITQNELVVISKKFPNILLPSVANSK